MTRKALKTVLLAGAAIAAAGAAGPAAHARPIYAAATSTLQELIVTARRREEDIQTVPLAVTALSGETLKEQQITTGADLQYVVPSLSLNQARSHQNSAYSIRGLGQAVLAGPSVVNYFSEVPSPTVTSSADAGSGQALYDVSSIQVLKGPQGTLFGRTAVAGAILYTPQHPIMGKWDVFGDAIVGSYGKVEATVGLNVPIRDYLAARLVAHTAHTDGYTKIISGGDPLDEEDNQGFRLSLEFASGPFRNYAVLDNFVVREAGAANVISGANTTLAALNRTAPAFAAVCTQALAFPVGSLGANVDNSSLTNCENQRVAILAGIRQRLTSEDARIRADRGAVRAYPAQASPLIDRADHITIADIFQYDLPQFGLGQMSLRNIFGYQMTKQLVSFVGAGIGGLNDSAYGTTATSQQVGNGRIITEGPYNKFYSEELQLNGDYGKGMVVYTLGYFYQHAPITANTAGVNNIFQQFGGVAVVNLGWGGAAPFLVDGQAEGRAYFGQATIDLGRLGLKGVHVTGGYRHSSDTNKQVSAALVTTLPAGTITPGARSQTRLHTDGDGWTVALDYQPIERLTLYATARRGYKPGGINVNSPPPGHETFKPETVQDIEVGVKARFEVAGMTGHAFADYYHEDYTNIQRPIRASAIIAYTDNAASARLQGFELEGAVQLPQGFEVFGSYSYNDAKYKSWMATDPLSLAPVGTILDLSNNPFSNAPKHKLNITGRYTRELGDNVGEVSGALSVYYQSQVWFDDQAERNIQVLLPLFSRDYLVAAYSEPGYTILNARIDWKNVMGSKVDAGLFVTNLTDKVYAVGGIGALASVGLAQKYYAAPRMFGFELSYRLGQ